MYSHNRGVSLVELSIVILVIGLLVGAVSGGVALQKASELRSIMTDVEQFRVAISGFDEKYRNLPGDMPDAHDYWGADCDGTAGNCNGNGDGNVDTGFLDGDAEKEMYRAWQHMNLAGFIDGEFTGMSPSNNTIPAVNSPATSRANGAFIFVYLPQASHSADEAPVGNYVRIGSLLSLRWAQGAFLDPQEAYSIDEKMDDSLPDSGKVQGRGFHNGSVDTWDDSACLSGTYPNRTYNRTLDEIGCTMHFTWQ